MDDEKRRTRRRRGLIGGLVALVVVLAAALGYTTLGRSTRTAGAGLRPTVTFPSTSPMSDRSLPALPTSATPTPTATGSPATECPPLPTGSTVPTDFTRSLTWTPSSVPNTLLPKSAATGPARVIGGAGSCFAHSAGGVVVASIRILNELLGPSWAVVMAKQVDTTSPGYARALTSLQTNPPTAQDNPVSRVTGFRIAEYTPGRAVLSLIYSGISQPPSQDCPVELVWTGSDWKLRPSDSGTLTYGSCTQGTPTDFTPLGV